MTLGERLCKLRKEKGLSQEEAADKINVTRQTISKWELDQSLPDFDKIVPICKLYGITSDELFENSTDVLIVAGFFILCTLGVVNMIIGFASLPKLKEK